MCTENTGFVYKEFDMVAILMKIKNVNHPKAREVYPPV